MAVPQKPGTIGNALRDRLSETTDKQLLERMALHDQEALADLYDRYGRIIYSLALAIVRDDREAENVVQMTFLKVWNKAASYDPERASVGTWLAAVTRNQAIDRLRRLKRGPERVSLEDIEARHEPRDAGDIFQQTLNTQRRKIVLEALEEIPPEQREALLLAYYRGLSQSQVAERLGQPLGTVKTRIRLGLDKLRRRLASGLKS